MAAKKSQESTIQDFISTHGDKYDYSSVVYVDSSHKVTIRCPVHGEFNQRPNDHRSGKGCVKCGKLAIAKARSATKDDFICKARDVHGTSYDYTEVVYVNARTHVVITCRTCHTRFKQKPTNHLVGRGCQSCGKARAVASRTQDTQTFVRKAQAKHGTGAYDYTSVKYVNTTTPVRIKCLKCSAVFEQRPGNHLTGNGCRTCAQKAVGVGLRSTVLEFINEARSTHADKYDYSQVEYTTSKTKVRIACPDHGIFMQAPYDHIAGKGCGQCGRTATVDAHRLTTAEFTTKACAAHSGRYSYINVVYIDARTHVSIQCSAHGAFAQVPSAHLAGKGCPKCKPASSAGEDEMFAFVRNLCVDAVQGDRTIIKPLELDITIPSKKVAIEYNGNIWHSMRYTEDRNYHTNKRAAALAAGYRIIFIRSDEWNNNKIIVKSILTNALGKTAHRHYARKCDLRDVPIKEWQVFVNDNHIQGACGCKHKLGLYDQEELVATIGVASTGNMVRFATKLGHVVVGGLSRLCTNYTRRGLPRMYTYCEKRLFSGAGYMAAGFEYVHETRTDLAFVHTTDKWANRRNFQKKNQAVRYVDFDWADTEAVNAARHGWYQLFMCGHIKFQYKLDT